MDNVGFRMIELQYQGYCCSQIMLILALEARGAANPDLVRASGGLCYGAGMSGEVCGALSGGACLIALYAGKGAPDEEADHRLPLMMSELSDWFREEVGGSHGGIRCDEILGAHPDKSRCGPIVATTFARAVEILGAHGFDFQGVRVES